MTQDRPSANEADLTKVRSPVTTPHNPATLTPATPVLDESNNQPTNPSSNPTLHRATQIDNPKTLVAAALHANVVGNDAKTEINPSAIPEPSARATEMVHFEPGVVIKQRFLLKEQIGRGGMGIVFAAVDRRKTEALDPNPMVAMKILNADFAQHPQALMALQREARKAQTLAHPNIATVFDFDRDGNSVFMVMELLSGRPLDVMIREVRGYGLERNVALPIIKGIAEGLAYSHKKGLVHSDLKPANIFFTDENVPKILDFGIARAMPSFITKQKVKDVFDAGSLGAYTEGYATAEMIEGSDPDPADDVYALGLIAYELLTGFHAYKNQGAIEAKRRGLKPEPIKGLSRREWKTIESSLAFDRAQRPKDAAAFLKSLAGITKFQIALMAVSVVFAVTAIFFGYRSYQAEGPAIPFEQLPADTQQQFIADMKEGDSALQFYAKSHNVIVLQDAVEQYAQAYALHPRNRDATKALVLSADTALQAAGQDSAQRVEVAKMLAERSDYLAKYPPVRELLK